MSEENEVVSESQPANVIDMVSRQQPESRVSAPDSLTDEDLALVTGLELYEQETADAVKQAEDELRYAEEALERKRIAYLASRIARQNVNQQIQMKYEIRPTDQLNKRGHITRGR